MKKKLSKTIILLLGLILVLGIAGCGGSSNDTANQTTGFPQDPDRPDRVAEIYGKVKSIEGNKVVIAEMERLDNPNEMSDEDKAKKKEQMQSLSEEERKKLREANEKPTGKTLQVTVPVGIPVKVKEAGPEGEIKEGSLSDIKTGVMVSIWVEGGSADKPASETEKPTAEYVNISLRQ